VLSCGPGLASARDGLSDTQASLDAKRQRLQESLKLGQLPPDAELVDLARALDQFRLARGKELKNLTPEV